jgi:uncharacterized membrane protein
MAAGWRIAAAGLALAGYGLMSHWLMVHAAERPWAVAVVFGPLVLAVAGTGWQRRQPLLLAACAAGVAVLAVVVARGGVGDVNRMYVLQHAGIHLALGLSFGASLRAGSTPLITAMARSVHRRFTPELVVYTRWLTGVWTGYFLAMVAVSLTLYLLGPWPWWSLYANVFTPVSAAALFVGEHVLRYRRHPDFERVSLRTALGAYRAASAADAGGRP